ncbi:STAS domain-containing protein [Modestobacter sp. SSW1-42]|uniref:STAS domain-containing protein n=1 Tax=Modestobacter sp. SSW1-42 TaxID=596372 RepID=UPI003987A392
MQSTDLPGGIDLVEEDGGPVLRLRGEVDSLVVDAWDAVPHGGRSAVAVDLSAATFLDGPGLRLLLRATEGTRRSGRVPELRRASRTVQRMVEIAGMGRSFAAVP